MRLVVLLVAALVAPGHTLWIDDSHEERVPPPPLPAKKAVLSVPSEVPQSAANAAENTTAIVQEPVTTNDTMLDTTIFPFAKGFPPKSFLVSVVTAPDHFKARVAIRNVWKQYQMSKIVAKQDWEGMSLRFFIGNLAPTTANRGALEQQLFEEQNMYMDIVRLDSFNEAYLNLTSKTLAIVEWSKENGYGSIFKMDDDSFLRLDNMIQFLKAEMRPQYIYAGTFISDNTVSDNPQSKWYNRDLYDHDTYPDYAGGPGYYLGSKVLDYLYEHRHSFVKYRVEDAAVGIWSQNMANIDRVNLASHVYSYDCSDTQEIIYVNPVNADEMESLIQNVMMGDMCSNFGLAECKQFPCLCHPLPEDCEFINAKTWSDFANEQYVDMIPRLVQTAGHTVTFRRPALATANP